MAKIIALFGPQRAGKSSAADSLVENYGFTRMSFADPLYEMMAAMLGVRVEKLRTMPKHEPLDALCGHTLRNALQSLGTDWGRNHIGVRIWVRTLLDRVEVALAKGQRVVIDDCRFRNEYLSLKHMGAKFVRIDRSDLPAQANNHASEVEWDGFEADLTLVNSCSSVEDWHRMVEAAISKVIL